MAIRKIARMGHPVLRKKARHLSPAEIKSPAFEQLLRDMIETMNDEGGIGIAAPQIYESVAVAIVDYQGDSDRYPNATDGGMPFTVIINPKIKILDATEQSFWEGCLSVPELRGLVSRPKKIQVDYTSIDGKPQTVIAEGFLATVFQHEIDHLEGVIFVDRVKSKIGETTLAFTEEYQRYIADDSDPETDQEE